MCCGMTNYKKSRNQNDRCSLLVPFRIWNEIISRYQSQGKKTPKNSVKKKIVKIFVIKEILKILIAKQKESRRCN